jgi:hypothetical protein
MVGGGAFGGYWFLDIWLLAIGIWILLGFLLARFVFEDMQASTLLQIGPHF